MRPTKLALDPPSTLLVTDQGETDDTRPDVAWRGIPHRFGVSVLFSMMRLPDTLFRKSTTSTEEAERNLKIQQLESASRGIELVIGTAEATPVPPSLEDPEVTSTKGVTMSKFEKIQRNSYKTSAELLSATGEDFDWDYEHYHDARSQLHEQAEHGWGVAVGLEVEPVRTDRIQVRPGVAIDGEGKLIALSDDDIPPKSNLGWKGTRDFKGPLAYVTIGYGTDIKKGKSKTNDALDLQVFEPTVSLVAPEDLKDPTEQIVLAIVELNEDRTIKGLAPRTPSVRMLASSWACPRARSSLPPVPVDRWPAKDGRRHGGGDDPADGARGGDRRGHRDLPL